jgi:hypothetical protein
MPDPFPSLDNLQKLNLNELQSWVDKTLEETLQERSTKRQNVSALGAEVNRRMGVTDDREENEKLIQMERALNSWLSITDRHLGRPRDRGFGGGGGMCMCSVRPDRT